MENQLKKAVSFPATTNPEVSEREKANSAAVRALAGECMVLLKNDGTLPLKKTGKIALYGNGARDTVKGGTGSGDVYVRKSITIEEGLEQEGFVLTTKNWMDRQEATSKKEQEEYVEEVKKICAENGRDPGLYLMLSPFSPVRIEAVTEEDVAAGDTDTAVYVLARNSGEGKDRTATPGDYLMSEGEINNLKFIAEKYEKVVVLLNIGGVLDIKPLREIEGINAVVLSNQMGNITGLTVADLLKGDSLPSGKLTDTWAEEYKDYSSSEGFGMNDNNIEDEYYTEGIYTGYRYFDTFNVKPAYEFGFGLNYTDFTITDAKAAVNGNKITVEATVTNVGTEYPGKEVVQVYVSAPAGNLDKPYQELRAFAKTKLLAPGEAETVTMTIYAESLASYCTKCASWVMESGNYIVRVGNSSRNTHVAAVIALDERKVTAKLTNLFADPAGQVEDMKPTGTTYSYDGEAEEIAKAPVLALKAADLTTKEPTYTGDYEELKDTNEGHVITMPEVVAGKYTVAELVAQLTDEEMAYMCVGNSVKNKGFGNVVGNASRALPGAAGETSDLLEESRGIYCMELCDGPAGLRLTPEYIETPEGAVSTSRNGEPIPADQLPEGVRHYQYCTAIPIAFALASSWNMDLIEQAGSIVGGEMDEFEATLWLAPGMNIHRNPLCGRNFEYYSEDPLLAGKCAAADTKGVQSHAGKGTTIKHYFANSQEDNRMFTNSHISERAIREIYHRNFQIAVEESQPMSIMTSYNLVNGVHSANNIDSLKNALRDEWGFRGMVMTDWLTTSKLSVMLATTTSNKYDRSDAAICVKAGNDLIEPGEMDDIETILAGLKDGRITRGDLQICVVRTLELAKRTHLYTDRSYNDEIKGEIITFC